MTLDHNRLGPEDIRTVMRTGASKQAIQDAMEVAFLFNIYDRLADSMGWDVPALAGGYYNVAARRIIKHGYGGRQARTVRHSSTA
jgi:hypothetical protein